MSDSSSQSKKKPGTRNLRSKNNTTIIHQAGAMHLGQADNITSGKGIIMS